MVYIPADFETPVVPELDKAERQLDAAVVAGEHTRQALVPDGICWLTPSKLSLNAVVLSRLRSMGQAIGH